MFHSVHLLHIPNHAMLLLLPHQKRVLASTNTHTYTTSGNRAHRYQGSHTCTRCTVASRNIVPQARSTQPFFSPVNACMFYSLHSICLSMIFHLPGQADRSQHICIYSETRALRNAWKLVLFSIHICTLTDHEQFRTYFILENVKTVDLLFTVL